jgi:hypothetical protein
MVQKFKRSVVFHPFLFAIYAVLGSYSNNSTQVPVQWVWRPLIVLLLLIAFAYFLLGRKLDDPQRTGLVVTLTLFWFFFGHFPRVLTEKSMFWSTPWGLAIAFALWTIPLAFLGSRWTWSRITNPKLVTSFLNVTSLFVILSPAFVTGSFLFQTMRQEAVYAVQRSNSLPVALDPGAAQRDIYLIILDGYGREDVLRDVYGFDNSDFIKSLRQKGFYVADKSRANYPQTLLSISSLLNMQYLDGFVRDLQNTNARGPVIHLLQQSESRLALQNIGYNFVALPSATLSTQMRDADIYLNMTWGDLNEFEGLLLSSTLANLAIEAWDLNIPVPSYTLHRRYILFSLEALENIVEVEGPKFVFSHIMAPHPPFVLDELGNPIQPPRPFNTGDASGFIGTQEEYLTGYASEIRYLDQRVTKIIDSILAQSDPPPIIIIQGDHGPGNYFNMLEPNNPCLKERYSILNAYYFPDNSYDALYPEITPINSFRVLFNQYYGADLELLEDKSYYATWFAPYVFSDVTNEAQSCTIVSD